MSNTQNSGCSDSAPLTEQWRLHLDVQITARKRWHYVMAPGGAVAYASHRSSDCFRFLHDSDIAEFAILHADAAIWCRIIDKTPW